MAGEGQRPLLSESTLEQDAIGGFSDHGHDAGSESENDSRDGSSVANDRKLLDEPEEDARLLGKTSRFDAFKETMRRSRDRNDSPGNAEKRRRRGIRRAVKAKAKQTVGGSGTVYEMEGGYKDSSSRSSSEFDANRQKWQPEKSSVFHYSRIILIVLAISTLFFALAFASYRVSRRRLPAATKVYNNGTHDFGATTILISLDGFRADFLHRGLTPALSAFVKSGVSPPYMLPSFPSVTFANHYTLVTGLHPESHGIVSNQFWDPEWKEEFYYTHTQVSMQSKWWEQAEPLWVTAENQGMKTAVHMWPGSEAHIHGVDPSYLDKFNPVEPLEDKVNQILHWLDLERNRRPQLIAAYVPDVDADGHLYGPNSTEIRATIANTDSMFTLLVEGLLARNLTEIVNLVVVSDHGMATTSIDRIITLDDFVDVSLIDHIDGWPLRGLRLKDPLRDVPILYKQLLKAAKEGGAFDVYLRENMPERYHFRNNPRIAPLWVVPKTGWAVVERHDFDVEHAKQQGIDYAPKGLHGYDHEHPLMRAIFIARGPAFPHEPNSRVPIFQNIEVYNIVCDSVGIVPHANNGTLHLPLITEGLHSDFDAPTEIPDEPIGISEVDKPTDLDTTESSSASTADEDQPEDEKNSEVEQAVNNTDSKGSWWKFIHEQLEKAKDWAKQFVDSIKNNKATDG